MLAEEERGGLDAYPLVVLTILTSVDGIIDDRPTVTLIHEKLVFSPELSSRI